MGKIWVLYQIFVCCHFCPSCVVAKKTLPFALQHTWAVGPDPLGCSIGFGRGSPPVGSGTNTPLGTKGGGQGAPAGRHTGQVVARGRDRRGIK